MWGKSLGQKENMQPPLRHPKLGKDRTTVKRSKSLCSREQKEHGPFSSAFAQAPALYRQSLLRGSVGTRIGCSNGSRAKFRSEGEHRAIGVGLHMLSRLETVERPSA